MTELSKEAQAVFSAWAKPVTVDRSLVISGRALEHQARSALAAALLAAADQVAPETPHSEPDDPEMLKGIWDERRTIRAELLAIAAELEGQ
jgi:hypothetical protein